MKTIANRLLTCLGIHLLFLELLVSAAKKKPRDYSPAIYYGDSDVYIGNPFSITCIISISDPIDWLKDGESIKNHNLRHGKDVHAFFISEHPIEGESDKIEARLNVKHALQIHEGKYQCNPLHSSYHYLKVHKDNQLSNTSNNINNKFSGTGTGTGISTGPSIASGVGGTSIGDSGSDGGSNISGGGSSNAVETNLDTSSISSVYSYRPKKPLLSTSSEQPSATISVLSSSSTTTSLLSGGGFGSVNDVNLTRIGPGKMKTRLNYDSDVHHQQQQQQQQRHQYTEQKQRHHGIISTSHSITSSTNTNQQQQQLPPFYYDQQQPELTTRNVMRNTGLGAAGGGNVHVIHHNKPPTGFFIDSTETDVTSIEDDDIVGGISLKPFITTSLPGGRKFHDDGHGIVDPLNLNRDINLYTKRPQQQSTLSSSSLSPSSSYSSTATTKLLLPLPSSTATTTTTGRKHHLDDLVSVTSSIIDINRMDSDVSKPIDDKGTILVYNIYRNLTLNCDLPQIGDRKIIWEKNGTDINSIETLKGRHKIKENKFIIDKTNLNDAGIYSCSIKDSPSERREFRAYAQVEVRVPSNVGVVEGETLKIQCSVIGTLPYITWEHENLTINSTYERYALTENDSGIKNAVLEIRNISLSDRGEYKCVGRNEGVESISKPAEDTSYIRVKGKLAALWPFLGICAEVFVLCAIILIYEKKRNKTDLDESDTDPNTEQEKLKTQRN